MVSSNTTNSTSVSDNRGSDGLFVNFPVGKRKNDGPYKSSSVRSTTNGSKAASLRPTITQSFPDGRKPSTRPLPSDIRKGYGRVNERKLSFESISTKAESNQIVHSHIDIAGVRIGSSSESCSVYTEDDSTDGSSALSSYMVARQGVASSSTRSKKSQKSSIRSNKSTQQNGSVGSVVKDCQTQDDRSGQFMPWGHISSSSYGGISLTGSGQKEENGASSKQDEGVVYDYLRVRGDDQSVDSTQARSAKIEDEYDSARPWRKVTVPKEESTKSVSDSNSALSVVSRVDGDSSNPYSEDRGSIPMTNRLVGRVNSGSRSQTPSEMSYNEGNQSGSEITELRIAKEALTQNQASFRSPEDIQYQEDSACTYRQEEAHSIIPIDFGSIPIESLSSSLPVRRKAEPFHPGPVLSPSNSKDGIDIHESDHSIKSQSDRLSSAHESLMDDDIQSQSSSVLDSHSSQPAHRSTASLSSRSTEIDSVIDTASDNESRLAESVYDDDIVDEITEISDNCNKMDQWNQLNFQGGLGSTTCIDKVSPSPTELQTSVMSLRSSGLTQIDEMKPYNDTELGSNFLYENEECIDENINGQREENNNLMERQSSFGEESDGCEQHRNERTRTIGASHSRCPQSKKYRKALLVAIIASVLVVAIAIIFYIRL